MNFKNLIIKALALVFIFSACKKIELEEQELAAYPVVVEAVMSNLSALEITVSRATQLSRPDSTLPVFEHATATITDETGDSETLFEGETGRLSGEMKAVPGRTFTLLVNTKDGKIAANAKAPDDFVVIDTVTFERIGDTNLKLFCHLQLPAERPVYARLNILTDGVPLERIFFEKMTAGSNDFVREIELGYFFPGQTIVVEAITFSKPAYEFYQAIGLNAVGINFYPSQSLNPPTNLKGGAAGFFNVALSDTTSLIIW